jgi:hypothetical protein
MGSDRSSEILISPLTALFIFFKFLVFRLAAGEEPPAESGGDGVVYLYEDNGGDRIIRVDKAEGGAGGVEGLGDDEATDDGGVNFGRDVIAKETGAGGVVPAPVYE